MKKHRGFTIAEVSLSMAFIAMLLMAIAAIVIYSITLYQKGLTLRAINDTGLELVDEFTRTLSASLGSDATLAESTYTQTGVVYLRSAGNKQLSSVPYWGVFCTGTYSYAWNSGYTLNEDTYARTNLGGGFMDGQQRLLITAHDEGTNADKQFAKFRLLRIADPGRDVCTKAKAGNTFAVSGNAREVLTPKSEDQLALYDLKVTTAVHHDFTGHSFYSGSFVLGTIRGAVDITTTTNICKEPPNGLSTDFTYCAINKFNFAVRATGAK